MNSDENNTDILPELNFEDSLILQGLLLKIINNRNTIGSFCDLKNFSSLLTIHKILYKLNKLNLTNTNNSNSHFNSSTYNSSIATNNQIKLNSYEYILIIKLLFMTEVFYINTISSFTSNCSLVDNSNMKRDSNNGTPGNSKSENYNNILVIQDLNEFSHKIYSLLLDSEKNDINMRPLDLFVHIIISEFVEPLNNLNMNFEKYIEIFENSNSSTIKLSQNKVTFENFSDLFCWRRGGQFLQFHLRIL
jgi:hypothetical protein